MSDGLVKRAREVLNGVTPGPWKHVDQFGVDSTAPHGYVANAGFGYDGEPDDEPEANAHFIAAARELVPAMADRIEELEAALSSIEIDHMLTNNGNLWRFWSNKANAIAEKNTTLGQKIEELEAKLAKAVGLVKHAFNEGFGSGMDDVLKSSGGITWYDSRSRKRLAEINGGGDT